MKTFRTLGELMDPSSIGSAACPLYAMHARERINRAQTDRAWAARYYPSLWQRMVPHVVKVFFAAFCIWGAIEGTIIFLAVIASIGGGR